MKKSIIGSLVLVPLVLSASDIQLAWTASPTSGVTNYVLYANTNTITDNNKTNSLVIVNAGNNTNAWVSGLTNSTWFFATSAQKNGVESIVSGNLIVEVPQPPVNMRTVVIQYGGVLTNFYDVGFFRLKIGN